MKFRKNLSLIEVTSVSMLESSYEKGASYLVMETQTHRHNGGTFSELLMEDYDLPFDTCLELLNQIHEHFDRFPHRAFDLRHYATAEKYVEHTGGCVIYRDLK